MRRLLICSFMGLALSGAQAALNVVTTTPDLAAIALAIGGSRTQVSSLARPTEDPHFVEPKPSLVLKLRKADVLIEGGAELETGWLPPLIERAGNSRINQGAIGRVLANEGVSMLEVPAALNRADGDIHASGNPHYLVDPGNGLIVARHLAKVFSTVDPEGQAVFESNLKAFVGKVETMMLEWEKTLAPHKGAVVVGYHNAWPYFGRRFGLDISLFLEPKPGIPATPAHLASVLSEMKKKQARVVIVDCYLDKRTAQMTASRTGAVVVDVTHFPGGVKGSEGGYFELIDYLVKSLANALNSKPASR